jgi:hypothetical protein
MYRPPNSPNCNVLDLGFFAALQAAFHKEFPNNIDDIVTKVNKAYDDYPPDRANRVFLTLQSCLREILHDKEGQHYKIPHLRNATLERIGVLPRNSAASFRFPKLTKKCNIMILPFRFRFA